MEPVEYLRALVRRWPIIAVAALIGAALTYAGTDARPAPIEITYQAVNTLLVTDNANNGFMRVGSLSLNQVPTLATTGVVPERVAKVLDYQGAPAALAARVAVNVDPNSMTVTFTSTGINPDEIVRLSDAFSDQTVKYLLEKQLSDRNARLTKIQDLVAKKLVALQDAQAKVPRDPTQADPVDVAQRDSASRAYQTALDQQTQLLDTDAGEINLTLQQSAQPVQLGGGGFTLPRTRKQRVPLGTGLGALLGAGLALVVERLDSRLRERRRAEEAFAAPVLVEFPVLARRQRGRRILVGPEHHHAVAEDFRSLRTSVMFMQTGGEQAGVHQKFGVIMITSPGPGEGKTTTAMNLAAAFAETGRRVVLVNADFRRPTIVKAVIAAGRPPLPGGLMSLTRLPPSEFLVPTDVPGVDLLDLAPLAASAGDLTRATVKMAAQLRHEVDVVVVDTPPLAVTTEALEFVPISEVVILIGRIGVTSTEGAKRAAELVQFAGAKRVGVALTASGSSRVRGARYYDYYSDAGPRTRRSGEHRPSVPAAMPADQPALASQTAPRNVPLDPLMGGRSPGVTDQLDDLDLLLADLDARTEHDDQ